MLRNGSGLSWSQRHLLLVWPLAPGLIFSICLVFLLATPLYSEIYPLSEQDWQALLNYFSEIEMGLNMTEQPLNEIKSYFKNESNLLQIEKTELKIEKDELQSERQLLQQEKNSLDKRELELNEREQRISEREQYYSDMEKDLQRATKKLQHNKWFIPTVISAGIILAGYAGYRIGKAGK